MGKNTDKNCHTNIKGVEKLTEVLIDGWRVEAFKSKYGFVVFIFVNEIVLLSYTCHKLAIEFNRPASKHHKN